MHPKALLKVCAVCHNCEGYRAWCSFCSNQHFAVRLVKSRWSFSGGTLLVLVGGEVDVMGLVPLVRFVRILV